MMSSACPERPLCSPTAGQCKIDLMLTPPARREFQAYQTIACHLLYLNLLTQNYQTAAEPGVGNTVEYTPLNTQHSMLHI